MMPAIQWLGGWVLSVLVALALSLVLIRAAWSMVRLARGQYVRGGMAWHLVQIVASLVVIGVIATGAWVTVANALIVAVHHAGGLIQAHSQAQ